MNYILMNKIQKILGYYFIKTELLQQALTHRSANIYHNERLEFLGDAILNFIISHILYKYFPNINEGDMSRMRATLVKKNTLAKIALKFNLGKYLILGPGEIKSGGAYRESILANAIEALIGGIFLDSSNITTIQNLIFKWYNKKIKYIIPGEHQKDSKTKLQEYLQAKHSPLPEYEIIQVYGESHYQYFTIQCDIIGIQGTIIGIGSSRRKAEQNAAYNVLMKLGIQ